MRPWKVGIQFLLTATVMSGCGEPSRTVPASEVLSRIRNTTPVASSRYSVAASVAADRVTGGRFVPLYHGGGIFDFLRGQVSVDLSFLRPRPGPEGNPLVGSSDIRVILGPQGGYWRNTDIDRILPSGKEWIRIRRKDVRTTGLDLYWFVHGDPTQELRFLLRQTRRLEKWGREEVHRIDADHYRVNVSTGQIATALRAGETGLSEMAQLHFQALIEYLGTTPKPVVVDVWIDDRGRVIRTATTVVRRVHYPDSPIEKNPTDVTHRQVFDYFDYDKHWVMLPSRKTIADASVLEEL